MLLNLNFERDIMVIYLFRDDGGPQNFEYNWWAPNYGNQIILTYMRAEYGAIDTPCDTPLGCQECKIAKGPNGEDGPHINHPTPHMQARKYMLYIYYYMLRCNELFIF